MTIKRFFLAAFCMLAVSLANAQTATIKGFVYAAENGEPIPFASVFLKGTTFESFTDINGYYSMV